MKQSARFFLCEPQTYFIEKSHSLTRMAFSWHTLTKSIRTASFFEIDPCFEASG